MIGVEGLCHVVLERAIRIRRDQRRDELRGGATRLDGKAASQELNVVAEVGGTEDNAQHSLDAARGVVVEGTTGDRDDAVIVGLEARLGHAVSELVESRGLVGQDETGNVDAVAAHGDADGPGDEFAGAALVVQPAVFLLAALGCTLRGSEGEPRVVGEGDAREGDIDLHLIREAVYISPVAVILRLQTLGFVGALAAAPIPVVEGILKQGVSATQVGRPCEVPRCLASIPVGPEDVDQPLDAGGVEELWFDPGNGSYLSSLKMSAWSNRRKNTPRHTRVREAKNSEPIIQFWKQGLPDVTKHR